jgi:hypothetical protein
MKFQKSIQKNPVHNSPSPSVPQTKARDKEGIEPAHESNKHPKNRMKTKSSAFCQRRRKRKTGRKKKQDYSERV